MEKTHEKAHQKAHQIAQFCVVAPIFPASRVHGPRCTGQGSRCCRLPPVTMCARFENVCTNWPKSVHTNNSLYFNGLQKCVHELHALHALSGFVLKSIVFLKKFKIEISSKKPCTQCTHCYSPYTPTVLVFSIRAHNRAHTVHTPPNSCTHVNQIDIYLVSDR